MVPFVADRVWQALVAGDPAQPASVHLARWPKPRPQLVDTSLSARMELTWQLVEAGRAARAASGVKIRQPLSRALVAAAGWETLPADLRGEIADELNVATLESMDDASEVVDYLIRPRFREIGRRFGARTQQVAQAIRAIDPAEGAAALQARGKLTITIDGEPVTLGVDEIDVRQTPRSGWFVATQDGLTVALDLEITPELRRAGIARDTVRLVQQARKDGGLQITDRIDLYWQAEGETARAIREHQATISDEVLATTLVESTDGSASMYSVDDDELSLRVWIAKTSTIES
jgi:isoleucyl-tRNA synthetase